MSDQLTEEQQKDVDERIEKFKDGHKRLVEELMVDLTAFPMYTPTGPYAYATSITMEYMDLKYRPKPKTLHAAPPQKAP